MIAGYMFGATLPTFTNCADRFCLSGYGGGGTTMEERASKNHLCGDGYVEALHIIFLFTFFLA